MKNLQKVCPVVLRESNGCTEILAFRHPIAGLQLIKGTVEANESLSGAAVRELREESGVIAKNTRIIGKAKIGKPPLLWHFFLIEADPLAEAWCYKTEDDFDHIFEFFWHPIDEIPDAEWHSMYHDALKFIVSSLD